MSTLRLSRWELFLLSLRKAWHDVALFVSEPKESWQGLSSTGQTIAIVLSVLLVVLTLDRYIGWHRSPKRLGLPVLKVPKGTHAWDYKTILDEGARRYPNDPYIISYAGYEYVVYPSSLFDEVKRLTAPKASAVDWFTQVLFQGWRLLGTDSSALHKTAAVDLARTLPRRVLQCQDEAKMACDASLGPVPEWQSFPLFSTVQQIVVTANSTGLVGPRLGSDKRWLNAVQRFPMALMVAVYISHTVPRLLRPMVSMLVYLPARALYWYMKTLVHFDARKDLQEYEDAIRDEKKESMIQKSFEKKFPMTAWLMSRYRPEERNLEQIKHDFVLAMFHATPSTSATLYCILSELVVRRTLIDELREELLQVMVDGRLPQTQLGELKKLDSFMRESARANLFQYLILFRKLREPVQLSVGPKLPAGSFICVDGHHLTTSEAIWKDPATFDPMRFLKLRQQEGQENWHQFTSLGSDPPIWGDGPQACPGRAYAGFIIKIILAHLLMHYDFQLAPGAGKPSRSWMPNGSMAPDMKARIMIRKRR
ncbi:hypothetical protein DL768_010763 [Monosporascus sp. mg162]|nr:hypothetical protein DL768_010763 [Monosporascus sp. mg162]